MTDGPRLRVRAVARFCVLAAALAAGLTAPLASATTASATTPPDGRGYELVSFPDAGGKNPARTGFTQPLNDDAILWGGLTQPFGDAPSGASPIFLATRTATGWQNTALIPPGLRSDRYTENPLMATDNGAFVTRVATTTFPGSPPEYGDGRRPVLLRTVDGAWHTLAEDSDPATDPTFTVFPTVIGGMSADGGAVGFSTGPTPPGVAPEPTDDGGSPNAFLYRDGRIRRLSNDAGVDLSGCTTAVAGAKERGDAGGTNAVSADGRAVFLLASGYSGGPAHCPPIYGPYDYESQLYLDRDGVTTLISVPTDGTPAPGAGEEQTVVFAGAAPDANTAYFTTAERLTADATSPDPANPNANLYRWQAASGGRPAAVTCLSCSDGAGTTSADDVTNNVRVSSGGEYVWFHAVGPSQGQGPAGQLSIFAYHDGAVRYVAPDGTGTALFSGLLNHDGSVLVFQGGDAGAPGPLERAVDGPGGASIECVSCSADGTPGAVSLPSTREHSESEVAPVHIVSDDGNTIAFSSTAQLAPGSSPGASQVYRWRAGQGLALVGTLSAVASVPWLSRDASNLVFQSSDALVPGTDGLGTAWIYDARIGGGFPSSAVSAPACSGDACQGDVPAPPAPPPVASRSSRGTGLRRSGAVPKIPRLHIRALGASARSALARGRRVTLIVEARGSGTVRARASARWDGHAHPSASASARLRSAGRQRTLRLMLRLGVTARRRLAGGDRLPFTVTVTLAGARTQTLHTTLAQTNGDRR